MRIQHRKGAMKRDGSKPTKEGELLTMAWIIFKCDVSKGEGGETVLMNLLDVGTDWLTVYPSVKRDAEAAYNGILKAYGNRCKVKYCHMDDAPELKKACKMHRIPFETSAPYIHQSNGLIESHNRIELYGGKVSLNNVGHRCASGHSVWLTMPSRATSTP